MGVLFIVLIRIFTLRMFSHHSTIHHLIHVHIHGLHHFLHHLMSQIRVIRDVLHHHGAVDQQGQ